MIIVLPVSRTDDEVKDDFIRIFKLFGSYDEHDLVLVCRPHDYAYARDVYTSVRDIGFNKTTHWVFEDNGRRGWPGGPNHYWHETVKYLQEDYGGDRQQPWLWLEMDMTPLKHGWLDDLQQEYDNSSKPFMGNLQWTTTTTSEKEMLKLCQHLVGAAIYPPAGDMDKYSKLWSKVNKVNTAWDVLLQWELPQHAHETELIQMLFRTGNYKKIEDKNGGYIIQGEDREPWPDPTYTFSKPVDIETAAVVHGCNDGSLARLIYEEETGGKIEENPSGDILDGEITYGEPVSISPKRKLPVFFHVPKCAGTYTYNIIFRTIKKYISNKRELLNVVVKSGEFTKYRIACTSKRPLTAKYKQLAPAKWAFCVDYNDLVIDDLDVYFVEVGSSSFGDYKDFLYKSLPVNLEPYEFIFLRDPYDSALSFYNYLISSQSSHEPTGGKITAKSFIDYLNSNQLQSSWLIHALLKIPDSDIISHYNYKKVCGILDEMIVSDISDVDNTILKVLEACYNLTVGVEDLKACRKIYANKTINTIEHPYETLNIDTKSHFEKHTKWDYKLYNKYTQT